MAKRFSLVTEYNELELAEIIKTAVQLALEQYSSKVLNQSSNSPPTQDRLLTRRQVCAFLGITLPTLGRLQREGILKAIIIGGSYRYSKKHIDKVICADNKSGTN